MNYIELSKEISYLLRHAPSEYGLVLDPYGWADQKIIKEPVLPPEILYHGTARRFLHSIISTGLVSKGRQYVFLSEDVETAAAVGKRRDPMPVILQVDAKQSWENGIKFYHGNEDIWLADNIPAKYLGVL